MKPGVADTFERMDRMYAPQKWIYDITRAYYLLGRDQMLDRLHPLQNATILDVGCGTGRNLLKLAKLYPTARLAGLDPSSAMLEMAERKLAAADSIDRVTLIRGVAEDLPNHLATGDLPRPDHILFSYSLSIIPDPCTALRASIDVLADRGRLDIVDFGPMDRLPTWVSAAMRTWLGRFHVWHKPEVASMLQLSNGGFQIEQPLGAYYELIRFTKY